MNKPQLLVVTGRPASGKTTLAHTLAREINCPLISRDELKEGYIHTLGTTHDELNDSAAWHIYEAFFETIDLLILKNISIVVEAAFQDQLWKRRLDNLAGKAILKVILCTTSAETARQRFEYRLAAHPDRERFHGDGQFPQTWQPLVMNVQTLEVDTTQGYSPGIAAIINFSRPIHSPAS